jgi:hypothetical protein
LRQLYSDDEGALFCQMCEHPMPFRLRNSNDYHFEAVLVADDLCQEDHVFHLALCPLCASRYQVLVKEKRRERTAQLDGFLRFLVTSSPEDPETIRVPVDLGTTEVTIRFVETHFLDLRTALQVVCSEDQEEANQHE